MKPLSKEEIDKIMSNLEDDSYLKKFNNFFIIAREIDYELMKAINEEL